MFGVRMPYSLWKLLVAPYCAIPRDYLSDTRYCALWGFWCLNMTNWVRYPLPLFWAFPPWKACEVEVRYPPPQKGHLSDTCTIPCENKAKACDTPLCDAISKRYYAITGLLSESSFVLQKGKGFVRLKNLDFIAYVWGLFFVYKYGGGGGGVVKFLSTAHA